MRLQYTIDKLGEKYQVVSVRAGVLDLSNRGDIAAVAARLEGIGVRL